MNTKTDLNMIRRVLFVTTGFDQVTNGPGVYAQHLWDFFSDDPDIDFHLIAVDSRVKHPNLHTLSRRPKGFGSAVYRAINKLAIQVINRLGPSTLLHANMAHIISPKFARESKSIVQVNDTEVCQWEPSLADIKRHGLRRNAALCWRKQRERAVVRSASRTICNSHHTARAICKHYRMDPSRVGMIYKAIDLIPFNRAGAILTKGDTPGPRPIVFVGSNWRLKGLDVLFRAIALLMKRKFPVHLQVYGAPTQSTHREFALLAGKLNISRHVTFAGLITPEKLPLALAVADMLVLPSRTEALGLVAIEALATGIPVVASNVGGLPEIITAESCGKLIPPGDASALANAITSVLKYPADDRARMDRQQTVEQFGVSRLENELRELYSTVGHWS